MQSCDNQERPGEINENLNQTEFVFQAAKSTVYKLTSVVNSRHLLLTLDKIT